MTVRCSFAENFGEDQAARIEAAAEEHKNGVHDNKGSDPFKWAILICIGYECFTRPNFRKSHGITADVEAIKTWAKEHGQLASHDGDCDYITAVTGGYSEYVNTPEVSA